MHYCADTWFLLILFGKDSHAREILEGIKTGKDWLFIPYITYAETMKKLFQQGYSENDIKSFFELLENTKKVRFISAEKSISQEAAKISLSFDIPLIDAFIAATAKVTNCNILLAKDSDFDILKKRNYIKTQSW